METAYNRVAAIAANRSVEYKPETLAAAARLLAAWETVARDFGVEAAMPWVTDLALPALDAVSFRDRQK